MKALFLLQLALIEMTSKPLICFCNQAVIFSSVKLSGRSVKAKVNGPASCLIFFSAGSSSDSSASSIFSSSDSILAAAALAFGFSASSSSDEEDPELDEASLVSFTGAAAFFGWGGFFGWGFVFGA